MQNANGFVVDPLLVLLVLNLVVRSTILIIASVKTLRCVLPLVVNTQHGKYMSL